jgi:plasmid segregation protein ParM
MKYEIVGVDAGNHEIKVVGQCGEHRIISDIGEYRTRNLRQTHGPDDIEFEYEGRRGFAGTLARYESEFSGSIMGDTKAHEDALLRVLIGLWRYTNGAPDGIYRIVVGQPISQHTPEEKAKIKRLLQREHTIEINGVTHRINIDRVEIAAEGGAAFWSNPERGLVRIIDIGSATVNCASLIDGRYVDRDSFTLPFGMSSTKSTDHTALARAIATEALKKWKPNDHVILVGGAAKLLSMPISNYFSITLTGPSPVFANARGFYRIGRKLYGEGH